MSIPSDFNIFAAVFRGDAGGNKFYERVEYFNLRDLKNHGMNTQQAEEYATAFLVRDGEYLDTVIEEENPHMNGIDGQVVADVCGEVLQNLINSECFRQEDNDGKQPEMMRKLEQLVVFLSAIGYYWEG